MTAVWPASLPEYVLREGFNEQPLMKRATFESDTGPPIERPKGTVRLARLAVTMWMNTEQLATFEDFVFTDLRQATLSFFILHPRRREQVKVKIDGEPPYQIAEGGHERWDVSFSLLVIG